MIRLQIVAILFFSAAIICNSIFAFGFTVPATSNVRFTKRGSSTTTIISSQSSAASDWVSLTEDGAVQKRIIEEGSGDQPEAGATVEIDYVGTLGDMDWDVKGTIDCWLSSQQGLDGLADGFRDANIDAAKLMDPTLFTDDFVAKTLSLSNKIQIKKLVMAAKRLAKVVEEHPAGTQFDSNKERANEPYHFQLGKGKVIRAMDMAVATMKVGERIEMKCRTDYAYGAEGVRKRNGDVMVPPFATLCFDIKLLKFS